MDKEHHTWQMLMLKGNAVCAVCAEENFSEKPWFEVMLKIGRAHV